MFDNLFLFIFTAGAAILAWFSLKKHGLSANPRNQIESTQLFKSIEKVLKLALTEAKVLVGFDFKKVAVEIDQRNKTIKLEVRPVPEILSFETDFKFYDVTEGIFNKFKPEDYTTLLQAAKLHLKEKVEKSELMRAAQEQLAFLLEQITMDSGYKIDLHHSEIKLIEKQR